MSSNLLVANKFWNFLLRLDKFQLIRCHLFRAVWLLRFDAIMHLELLPRGFESESCGARIWASPCRARTIDSGRLV